MNQSKDYPPAVQMRGITKRFPGVVANDHIDFEVRAGEIHSLLGENGAGKTTLMNILSGIYHLDEGEIFIHGRKATLRSPRDAIQLGVGMIHQNFMLVQPHTVAENVTLGEKRPRLFLKLAEVERKVRELSERFGLKVDPTAPVWHLSVGEQQRVEIIKMLYRGVDILVMDEPTSVLTPQETRELFATLKRMADQGNTVIFISHKLDEVMAISHRITVLRAGRKVATVMARETSESDLARMMVGREVLFKISKAAVEPGPPVLNLVGLHVLNDKGLPAVKGIHLTLREGEILGIAGVAGNGQRELAEAITGIRPIAGGRCLVNATDLTGGTPRQFIEAGVAHIPEDRLGMALVPSLGVSDNLILKSYRESQLGRGPFLNYQAISERTRKLIAEFGVITPREDFPVRLLSGGNLQKVVLAREMSVRPRIMIAVHPTRGLDVGATEFVRNALEEMRESGTGVLLISEDLEEVLTLSDRIGVIFEGELMGIVRREEARIEEIGLMMAGTKRMEVVS